MATGMPSDSDSGYRSGSQSNPDSAGSPASILEPISKLLLDDLEDQLLLLDPPQGLLEQLHITQCQDVAREDSGDTDADENRVGNRVESISVFYSNELVSHHPPDGGNRPSIDQIPEVLSLLENVDTVFLGNLSATAEFFADADPGSDGESGQPGLSNRKGITRLLSYCRDRVRRRVFICLQPDSAGNQLPGELLFSLGYIKLPIAEARHAASRCGERMVEADKHVPDQIFFYSLRSYKTQPDWLNSRFWANPERWNLPN